MQTMRLEPAFRRGSDRSDQLCGGQADEIDPACRQRLHDDRLDLRDRRPAQGRLDVADRAGRGDEKIAGDRAIGDPVARRSLEPQIDPHPSAGIGGETMAADGIAGGGRRLAFDEGGRADLTVEQFRRARFLGLGDLAPDRIDPERFGKAVQQRGHDLADRGCRAAAEHGERDHAIGDRSRPVFRELVGGHVEARHHPHRIDIEQHGALKTHQPAVEKSAGAAELAAIDLDIVAGAVGRSDPKPLEAGAAGFA
ncbi:MAG: hypothetical protein PHI71_05890 [Acidiphilium sp.]|nr:hypothetical protein [Acidiphilium sp.]